MHILLIGKYPPCQGGMASTAYWVTRKLRERHKISTSVVTCKPDNFSTDLIQKDPCTQVEVVSKELSSPWFIPGDDLFIARLASAGIRMAAQAKPDVVETNYLAPFGVAAWIVAQAHGLPLIIRPAASDLDKLLTWDPVAPLLRHLLAAADLLVLNDNKVDSLKSAGIGCKRILIAPRYSPNPIAFNSHATLPSDQPTLLVATKAPFRWKLKAIDTVCKAIAATSEWSLDLISDGNHNDSLLGEATSRIPAARLNYRRFIFPDKMPAAIGHSWAVWAASRVGGVEDFPNLVWEAVACGRVCILGSHQASWARKEEIPFELLRFIDPDSPESVVKVLNELAKPSLSQDDTDLIRRHNTWCDMIADAYRSVADKR